jgi:hypothetical protein
MSTVATVVGGFALLIAQAEPHQPLPEVRQIDGTGNNLQKPQWGSANIPLLRRTTLAYEDGVGVPAGAARASARAISNAVCAQTDLVPNAAGASDFVWQWGQFLDHDIDLTPVLVPAEPFDIAVPTGDPWFDPAGTGTQVIPLDRSYYELKGGAYQQFNQITSWIDASNVYGSDPERARALRTLDGTGRLKTSAGELLPFNEAGLPNAPASTPNFFLAGDFRANEQVALTALHTLFVREHNSWVECIRREEGAPLGDVRRAFAGRDGRARVTRAEMGDRSRPRLSGDELYELARAIVAAEIQAITYREFLPVLLGSNGVRPYQGYRPNVRPDIRNVFATAAYRLGHSMLSPTLLRLDAEGDVIDAGDLPLAQAFFDPNQLISVGIEPYLRGLAAQRAQEIDTRLVDDVRNFLFGPPGAGGFDLAALNIQRGRDHGLPGFSRLRMDYGLPPAFSFASITSDLDVQADLASVYSSASDVDAWVGGLAEDHVPGAMVGRTLRRVLREQFEALRDGDRFWYEHALPPDLRQLVERQTLADIIRRNTTIGSELPDDVFRATR